MNPQICTRRFCLRLMPTQITFMLITNADTGAVGVAVTLGKHSARISIRLSTVLTEVSHGLRQFFVATGKITCD
jgi:hypothetical protein